MSDAARCQVVPRAVPQLVQGKCITLCAGFHFSCFTSSECDSLPYRLGVCPDSSDSPFPVLLLLHRSLQYLQLLSHLLRTRLHSPYDGGSSWHRNPVRHPPWKSEHFFCAIIRLTAD